MYIHIIRFSLKGAAPTDGIADTDNNSTQIRLAPDKATSKDGVAVQVDAVSDQGKLMYFNILCVMYM